VPHVPIEQQQRAGKVLGAIADSRKAADYIAYAMQRLRARLLSDLLSGDHTIAASYDRFLDSVA
jgi:hypothetical protein